MIAADTLLAAGFFVEAVFKFAPLFLLGLFTWRLAR
jgi:hypothetical protein